VTTEDPRRTSRPITGKFPPTVPRGIWHSSRRRDSIRRRAPRGILRFAAREGDRWGLNLPEACQRMDRALREFRIRGVKTNIPFLENVVIIRDSRRRSYHRFFDDSPELFRISSPATAPRNCSPSLGGDVILNGNPSQRKESPEPWTRRSCRCARNRTAAGSRQLLRESDRRSLPRGAQGKALVITDTTFAMRINR